MNLLISCEATAFILAYNRQLGDRALRTLVATANGEAPVPLLENEETLPAGLLGKWHIQLRKRFQEL